MEKKYWIAFIILLIVIIFTSVFIYFKIGNISLPIFENKKVEVASTTTKQILNSNKTKFIAFGFNEKNKNQLANIFDKLSKGDDNDDIAFYDKKMQGYFYVNSDVYWAIPYSEKTIKIGCNSNEFKVFQDESYDVGVCGQKVYIRGSYDFRVDGATLSKLAVNYFGDNKHTYFRNENLDKVYGVINVTLDYVEGNPTQMTSLVKYDLPSSYATANGKLYFKSKVYPKIDMTAFHKVYKYYYADNSGYYFVSPGLDNELKYITNNAKFEALNFSDKNDVSYVKIGENIYLGNVRLNDAIIERIKPFDAEKISDGKSSIIPCTKNCSYVWDGFNIYFEGRKIKNINLGSFKLVGYGLSGESFSSYESQPDYAKDNKYVYFGDKILAGANPNSFTPIYGGLQYFNFGKDNNSVYYKDKKIIDADPSTFIPLTIQSKIGCESGKYSKDENNVYFETTKIRSADVDTFKSVPSSYSDYGYDDNNFYRGNSKINESDIIECSN